MSRRFLPALWAFTLLFLLMQAPAMAASYVVAPFKVSGSQGYSYLGQAVPSMLTSRLFLQGQFEPSARQDAALKEKAPAGKDAAASLAKKYGADYVVWGNITVMGDQASLDVSALSPSGKLWTKASTSPVNALIGGLQNVADSINIEVFGRKDVAPASAASGAKGAASPNSAFMMNETHGNVSTSGTYLNSSLRYQGSVDAVSQLRSQMLKYECFGFDVADVDGDGKNEVLMLSEDDLYLYRWQDGNKLQQIAKYRVPASMRPILTRAYRSSDGSRYVILTGHNENDRCATSQVLQFEGGKFKVVVRSVDLYLNVVTLPPLYAPTLVAQASDKGTLVSGRVYEARISGSRVVRGGKVPNLPKKANLFGFAWLPGNDGKGDHVVCVTDSGSLATYNQKDQPLAMTSEMFCSGSVYVTGDRSIGGLSSHEDDDILHFVPIRMVAVDLDKDGKYELIASKPVTAAGQLFSNYRTYPQSEVHAMLWDGMGLNLLWKTRRIKGTLADLSIVDIDNNGVLDLAVCVNAHAGIDSGVQTRSAIYVYPLNTALVNAKPNFSE
ncbi:MAG: VCBS repeat-containing protein [Mailhella sp.]|nr:VCBS repeat-containing protein [Mailhella sp.]